MQLYRVDSNYCDYLRQFDKCVPKNADSKNTRPFVGIVFEINGNNYYAPLTSPKPKHKNMKNQLDFLKINNGIYGAINFNNMIPIPHDKLICEKYKILPTDTKADIDYKNLISNQITWCNANKNIIYAKAEKLYKVITEDKAFPALKSRCCNFKDLEEVMKKLHTLDKKQEPLENNQTYSFSKKQRENVVNKVSKQTPPPPRKNQNKKKDHEI